MPDAAPSARLVNLYQRAEVCRVFPAYKLAELKTTPAGEILDAMELLAKAAEIRRAMAETE